MDGLSIDESTFRIIIDKMALSNNLQIVCPVRGQLTVNKKDKEIINK